MSDETGLTVSEAAVRLGVVERRLRRLIARPEYAARTLTVSRLTRTGTRTATVLPADLVADLAQHLERQTAPADTDGDRDSDHLSTASALTRQTGGLSRSEAMMQQVIARQDGEIARLNTQVTELTAALHKALDLAKQNTAEAGQVTVSEQAESHDVDRRGAPTGEDGIDTPRVSWWQRFFERRR